MTDKELQRLKRGELLEILLEQSKEIDSLKAQLEEKAAQISSLTQKLEDRRIDLQEAGTIAEASFKLNGVFDAAEKAAQQYLDNLKDLCIREQESFAKKEAETETKCTAMMQATKERCDFMKENTEKSCNELETTTKAKCMAMETEVTERCQNMEADTKKRCEELTAVTDYKCRQREKEAEDRCLALDMKAKEDVDKRWSELSTKLEDFYNAHQGIRELLAMSKIDIRE